jgi:purine-cytosine permease-like protein
MAAATHDDDYSADPVPDSKRIAWHLAFFAEMGIATALFFLQVTSILTLRYGSAVTLMAIAYAVIAAACIGAGICWAAISTGFGSNLLARRALGYRGAVLFSLIYSANAFVYFAAEATIMGSSLTHLMPDIPLRLVLPAIALAMIPLVWFGMRLLARLQMLTFILYAVLLLAAIVISLMAPSSGRDWLHYKPATAPPLALSLLAAAGTMNSLIFISGLITSDYARFIHRSEIKIGTLFLGIGFQAFCFIFSGVLGIWFAVRYLNDNPGSYFVIMLSGWGTLFAIATQLRINLSNMYMGTISFVNFVQQVANIEVSRHFMVLLFGVSVSIALFFGMLSNLTFALTVIGMFTTCFTCLVLLDVYLLHPLRQNESASQAAVSDWQWPAVVSLVVSTATGCVFQVGVFGPNWAAMGGLVAAALLSILYIGGSFALRNGLLIRASTLSRAAKR